MELPADVMAEPAVGHPIEVGLRAEVEPDPGALHRAADLIAQARRPVLLVGNGVVRQGAALTLREFCAHTGLCVITTFMGKGVIDTRDEHFLFTAGLRAQDYAAGFLGETDLVICVGYDVVEWPPAAWNPDGHTKIICIDTEPPEIDALYVPEVELIGDLGRILQRLGNSLWNKPLNSFEVPPYQEALAAALDVGGDDDFPVKPQRVLSDLRELLAPHDIVISDVGVTSSGFRASGKPVSPIRC